MGDVVKRAMARLECDHDHPASLCPLPQAEARAEELERAGLGARKLLKELGLIAHPALQELENALMKGWFRAALSKQEPAQDDGPCKRCDGKGCEACDARHVEQEPREPCATCGGIGEVWNGQRGERFDMVQCKKCGGDGSTPNTEGRDG